MTPETPERYTPLTLEFAPTLVEGDEVSKPVAVCEPSLEHNGRIFLGVHPLGRRLGLHLLPEEARHIRDHLSKLLLEPEAEAPQPPVNWQKRIAEAAERTKKRKRFQFRIEFSIGSVQGVLGRVDR